MKDEIIKGRVWILRDDSGKSMDNIDTDQIYHHSHLAVTEKEKMGEFTFGNLPGWTDFPKKAKHGDIIICGKNFGSGRARQQAVDCFKSLGISLLVAESFGAGYRRDAINSGFPILVCPDICSRKENDTFIIQQGNILEVNFATGQITNVTRQFPIQGGLAASQVQLDIYNAGNLFNFGRSLLNS